MSIEHVYILSGTGALFFLLAGYLARSVLALRSSRELQRRLNEAETRNAAAVAEHAAAVAAHAAEIEKLQQDELSEFETVRSFAETRAALEAEKARRADAEAEMAHLQADVQRMSGELRSNSETLRLAAESLHAADGRVRMAERRSEELGRQLQVAKGARVAAENAQRERASVAEMRRQECERARASVMAAEAQLHERNALLESRHAELEAARAALAVAEKQLAARDGEVAMRDAAGEAARLAVNAAEAQVRERDEVIAGLKREFADARTRLATFETQLAGRDALIAAQQGELEKLRRGLADGQASSSAVEVELRERLAAVQSDVEPTRLRATALEAEVARNQTELRDLRGRLQASEAKLLDMARVQDENAGLREDRAHAESDLRALAVLQNEVNELRVALRTAQARLAESDRLAEENGSLRQSLAELQEYRAAASELERLQADYKRVRLDAEMMARHLQELRPVQAELADLRAQVTELPTLIAELESRRHHEQELEAQLYALGHVLPLSTNERVPLPADSILGSMEAQLGALLEGRGPRTAVLADQQGFLVAGAGESEPQEALAAFVAVVVDIVGRVRSLLPLSQVASVRLEARNQVIVSCHLFESAGSGLGLATIGSADPEPAMTRNVVEGLAAVVAGGESCAALPALEESHPIDGSN